MKSYCDRLSQIAGLLLFAALGFSGVPAQAQEYANDETPGIEEKLGETIPLDLTFYDEKKQPVKLSSLFTKPTVLTLVYLRCPNICSPLMHEVAATVDALELEAGIDYNLITVSFDDTEDTELVVTAKKNLLEEMENKIPPESWRFLTGNAENIAKLTDSVGFRFKKDEQDFIHAGTVIFLTADGKIVRYLPGLQMLASNMKMAILDAEKGIARSFMQQIQRLCFSFDDEARTYVFQVNRLVLGVTLLGLGVFLVYLLVFKKKKKASNQVGAE